MSAAQTPMQQGLEWRRERRLVEGRFVHFVVCGYGSGARYITNDHGWPKQFTLAEARERIQERNAEPHMCFDELFKEEE